VCIYLKNKYDKIIPELQQIMTINKKSNKKGSFLRVSPKYSSKTLLAGKMFKSIHGKTVRNQISYVYTGTKETKKMQKYVGRSVVEEKNSILL